MLYNGTDYSNVMQFLGADGRGLMAPFSVNSVKTQLGDDAVPIQIEPKEREITARFLISGNSWAEIKTTFRENYASAFYPNDLQYKTLVFDDEPNIMWYAYPSGELEITEKLHKKFIIKIPFTARNHAYDLTETTIHAVSPYTEISGLVAGTVSSRGVINFEIGSTPPDDIIIMGATGVVLLEPPSGLTLEGVWTIDLKQRTVKKDGVLAMKYVDFINTIFKTFYVSAGNFTINFSEPVVSANYTYRGEWI